jgi:hypothetical protein
MKQGINGRLAYLEARQSTPADNGAAEVAALCRDVLAMIDAGEITDWQGVDHDRYLSPTVAIALPAARYPIVWDTCQDMAEVVGQYAIKTGWRSPSHAGDDWRAYRANTAEEMADVARLILKTIEVKNEY